MVAWWAEMTAATKAVRKAVHLAAESAAWMAEPKVATLAAHWADNSADSWAAK